MATTLDEKIKAAIAEHGTVKTVLSVLFAVLTFGKTRGWFSKGAGRR